jgi:hypothetical protein
MTGALGLIVTGELAAELGARVVCDTNLLGRVPGNPVPVGSFVGMLVLAGLMVVLLFTQLVSMPKFSSRVMATATYLELGSTQFLELSRSRPRSFSDLATG